MTDQQKALARHALGLDSRHKQSYRNRFVVQRDCPDGQQWMLMCDAGYAERRDAATLPFGGCDLFWLTPSGAVLALNSGDQLDSEDFPQTRPEGSPDPAGGKP